MKNAPTPWDRKLGKALSSYRKKAHLTQAGLAGRINAASSEIKAYEEARRTPQLKRLCVIADVLGVTLEDLRPKGKVS